MIVANYDGVDTVTFSDFGDAYNYGGGTSDGRRAHSGTNDMYQLGLVQGVAGGTYHGDAVGNPNLNWLRMGIAPSAPNQGVNAIGFIIDGRDGGANYTDVGSIWVTLNDGTEAVFDYTKFAGVADSGLFFGYQAPAGKFITGIEGSRKMGAGNSFLALDDLTFAVTPEPMTLVLLAMGSLFAARRRHA